MIDERYLKYLDTAKEITGSNDIYVVIEAAKALQQYIEPKVDLPSYLVDPLVFMSKCKIQHMTGPIPYYPYDFQEKTINQIHHSEKNQIVIKSSRQMGMTTVVALYLLFLATTRPRQNILITGFRYFDCLERLKVIRFAIENASISIPIKNDSTINYVEFNNGSKITANAMGSHNDMAGHSYTHIFVDNAAYISYNIFEKFLSSYYSGIQTTKLIVVSNPRYAEGPYYELCRGDAEKINLPYHLHPNRDEEWAKEVRLQLGESAFTSEFGCQFLSPPEKSEK